MGFKTKIDEQAIRYKEFDEARIFIERPANLEDVQNAIDYMIVHKEFYYLLTQLKNHNHLHKPQIIDYLFSRLPCLKRQEDRELLEDLLLLPMFRFKVISYIFECCESFELARLLKDIPLNEDILTLALEHGSCKEVKEFMYQIQKRIKIEQMLVEKFFEIYGV